MSDTEFLSTRQVAARLGVSLGTVQHMVENGVLEAWKTVGGHRRIASSSVDAYLARRHQFKPSSPKTEAPLDILIAEDDPTLQLLYKLTMEKWDLSLKIRMVDNGFDGLIQVGQSVPDVLIADLMMPGMDGFEMIRRLRNHENLSQMDIIVVSALDKEEIAAQGGLPADVAVYGKPIPFHEIKGFMQARQTARQRKGL